MLDILDPNQVEVRINITVEHGTVSFAYIFQENYEKCPELSSLVFLYGNGRNDSSCTFYGTLAAVNLALSEHLRLTGLRDYYGEACVRIVVSDIGHSQVIPIHIRPLNDPPTITVPVHEDGSSTFHVINPDFGVSHLKGQQVEFGYELYETEVERPDTRKQVAKDIHVGRFDSSPTFFQELNGLRWKMINVLNSVISFFVGIQAGSTSKPMGW